MPEIDGEIDHVFKLFDEFDAWLRDTRMPFATEWITSGLHVRFDPAFRAEVVKAMKSPERFSKFVDYKSELETRAANMDY